jgi:hypothetical protein
MSDLIRFHLTNVPEKQCTLIKKVITRYILGIFICRSGGDVLYSFQVDPIVKVNLISNFIAALSMFGEENVGKIKRIFIEGLDIELNIVQKYDLIMAVFFRPNMVKDYLKEESKKTLDLFYSQFKSQIENSRNNQLLYQKFDNTMSEMIQEYLLRIGIIKEASCEE